MNELDRLEKKKKTNLVSTVFGDGMVVTAEDLDIAMGYPIALFQTLVRAYFGCGIVCGLKVHELPEKADKTLCVRVEPGVALDCSGHPLQLCDPVDFDLRPDPCAGKCPPKCVCIAISHATIGESPRDDGDACCGECHQPRCTNRRNRDYVRLRVFACDNLPDRLCAIPKPKDAPAKTKPDPCACMKACPHCGDGCGESWVLLACLELDYDKCQIKKIEHSRRKYVKPIGCHCEPEKDEDLVPPSAPGDGGAQQAGHAAAAAQ